jgi:proline dehydrogenase
VVSLEEQSNLVRKLVFRLVKKHIAGPTSASVLNVVRDLNKNGLHATVTLLNDHVDDQTKARYNTNAYIQFVKQVSRLNLNSDISIRLSQIGYWVDKDLLEKNIRSIMEVSNSYDQMLWIESEPNIETSEIAPLYKELKKSYEKIGIELTPVSSKNNNPSLNGLISKKDIVKLKYQVIKKEESEEKIDRMNLYKNYIDALMERNVSLTILDNDSKLLEKIIGAGKGYKRNLIFEIPLGYDNKRLGKLQKSKLNISVYVPYGKDWIPYFINRLAEGRVKRIAIALLNGEKTGAKENAKENRKTSK